MNGRYGDLDGPAAVATFSNPHGIDVDADGNIYISDRDNHKIRKLSTSGIVTTVAGYGKSNSDGPVSQAAVFNPEALAVNGLNIHVVSGLSERVIVDPCSPISIGLTATPYFSPNGDGSKDICNVNIAEIPPAASWTLTVETKDGVNLGTIGTGFGPTDNSPFPWNGTVGGAVPLQDGAYTLRLFVGAKQGIQRVIIDNTKPVVNDSQVSAMSSHIINTDQPVSFSNLDVKYNYLVEVTDPEVNGVNSGTYDPSCLIKSTSLQALESATILGPGKILIKTKVIEDVSSVRYSTEIEDNAGNRAEVPGSTTLTENRDTPKMALVFKGQATDAAGYRHLLDMTVEKNPFDPLKHTYYARSGLDFEYEDFWTFYLAEAPLKQVKYETDVIFVNEQDSIIYYKKPEPLEFVTTIPEYVHCFWSGGDYVKIGKYRIESSHPKFVELDPPTPPVFKVSDMPCIKHEDWLVQPVATLPIGRTAHIFDAHILNPPNKEVIEGYNDEIREESDLFSSYDGRLAVSRPTWPDSYPWPREYTYYNEDSHGDYTQTEILRDITGKTAYETILRMASAIKVDPSSDSRKRPGDESIQMPVVFPSKYVFWVGTVPSGTGYRTIFPAYDRQTSHEGSI